MSDEAKPVLMTQEDINDMVLSHDRDIRAVKAVIGFLVLVGGAVLGVASFISDWIHK